MFDGLLLTKKNSIFHMLRYCIFIGFVSGYASSLYTLLVEHASHYSSMLYGLVAQNKWYILLIAFVLFVCFMICTHIVRLSNVSRGSGVPQAMGILRGAFIMKWARGFIVMLVCSVVGTFAGLSLGSEGPAMIIGGLAAMGASKLIPMYSRNYMVTGGVASGLAVAFNAPLSGLFITLEEGHKRYSPVVAFNISAVVITAIITSYCILGMRTIIPVGDFNMSFLDVPFLLLLGIIIALCGVLFNWLLLGFRQVFKKLKFKRADLRFLPPFALALIIGVLMFPATGGGAPLIKSLLSEHFELSMLLCMVVAKLLFTIICTSTGVPGGIFVPMLSVGALVGCMYAQILGYKLEINMELYIIAGMVAYFTAVSHGYYTALILAMELTHNPLYVLPALLTCTVTKLMVHLLKTHGLYDQLLNLTIKENTEKLDDEELFSTVVQQNSFADGRTINDIILPSGVEVVKVNEKVPKMTIKKIALKSYDMLTFRIHSLDNLYVKHTILALFTAKNKDDDLDGTPPKLTL